jgi:hypothetical protein
MNKIHTLFSNYSKMRDNSPILLLRHKTIIKVGNTHTHCRSKFPPHLNDYTPPMKLNWTFDCYDTGHTFIWSQSAAHSDDLPDPLRVIIAFLPFVLSSDMD